MERLAGFKHDVIGHIDDVVDRANTAGLEPRAQPRRRRPDSHFVYDARRVTRTQLGIFNRQR